MERDIKCIYCNATWTPEMLTQLGFADCSYTPDCVSAEFRNAIDIHCPSCERLVYRKELEEMANRYTDSQWADTNSFMAERHNERLANNEILLIIPPQHLNGSQ